METTGTKVQKKRNVRVAFLITLALSGITTELLLLAEIFNISIGPVTMIFTRHGLKSGMLGGISAVLNGDLDNGLKLIFYGLTRRILGTVNIALFVITVSLAISLFLRRHQIDQKLER